MENLFEMKLKRNWVRQGNFTVEINNDPKVYVDAFSKAFVQITINFNIPDNDRVLSTRDDTEVTLTENNLETVTIVPVSDIGDNLENLFTILHDILDTLYVYENKEEKDYE